jgi:hypothetical protein
MGMLTSKIVDKVVNVYYTLSHLIVKFSLYIILYLMYDFM